jgi:hypothetical protein
MASKQVNVFRKLILVLSVLSSALFAFTQNTAQYKILVFPFRPKLYLGLYDAPINKATKWDAKTIKHYFRKNTTALLNQALSQKWTSIDLCSDTNKYKFDLGYLYSNTGTELVKLNTTQKEAPQTKSNKNIKKGRLVNTSLNLDLYYTHTQVASKELFKAYEKRFKSNVYVTINQFDMVPDDMNDAIKNENSSKREIKIHYSIFNQEGKHIFGDYASITFPKTENNPELILSKYLKPLMQSISDDVIKVLQTKK